MVAHEEVRERLGAYARGVLGVSEASAVRAHLASGCRSCLEEVFAGPVGVREDSQRPRSTIEKRGTGAAVALGLALVIAIALAAGLLVRERELRATTLRALRSEAARRQVVSRAGLAAEERLERAERTLREEREAAAGEHEALREDLDAARREAGGLRRALRAGRLRLAEVEAELEAGRAGMDVGASEGVEMRTLSPARPFVGVTGHVVWRPGDGRMLIHAAGLPAVPRSARYVARVTLVDGRVLGADLTPSGTDAAVALLVLPSGSVVDAVEVRRAADARRLLIADGRMR